MTRLIGDLSDHGLCDQGVPGRADAELEASLARLEAEQADMIREMSLMRQALEGAKLRNRDLESDIAAISRTDSFANPSLGYAENPSLGYAEAA